MDFTILEQCRGDGKGYVAVRIADAPSGRLCACGRTSSGVDVVCAVYDLCFPGEDPVAANLAVRAFGCPVSGERLVVVVVPLLDDCELLVGIFDASGTGNDTPLLTFAYKPLESKIRSRLAYLRRPERARLIRDIDRRRPCGVPQVMISGIYQVPDGRWSCRFQVSASWSSHEDVVRILDGAGRPVEKAENSLAKVSDSRFGDPSDSGPVAGLTEYSVILDALRGPLYVSVSRSGGTKGDGSFVCLTQPMFDGMVAASAERVRPISVDATYPGWLERHRATVAEVEEQRDVWKRWPLQPLVSIVVVVFRPPESYLRAMLDSVLAQSYDRFELILVNVSGECPEVDGVLRSIHDDRVRVLTADNVSIADNTNIGIAAAQGDYLAFVDHDDVIEPDALYRYVKAINDDPDADLLYCDEDLLRDGAYEWPTFKPDFMPDLLYSHNYITHMLMVSAHVLHQVERSGTDVAGAQDYDLTLKCVEKARAVKHVPFMLYHWRVHRDSTSNNPDSKPYADEAGRLALQRHFDRIGVDAVVEGTDIPFCYRPRYRFGNRRPKVSVVIPVRGGDSSVYQRLGRLFSGVEYADYDITVVMPDAQHGGVESFGDWKPGFRVVAWPGTYRYAAMCNYGAKRTDGDLLLLLDSHLESMDSAWMDSMVGPFARPEVGVVGAKLLDADGLIRHGGYDLTAAGLRVMHRNVASDQGGYMDLLRHPSDCLAVSGECMMVRRDCFERAHGLDEDFSAAYATVDLCLRIGATGKLVVFDPYSVLTYRDSGETDSSLDDVLGGMVHPETDRLRILSTWASALDGRRYVNANVDGYIGGLPM